MADKTEAEKQKEIRENTMPERKKGELAYAVTELGHALSTPWKDECMRRVQTAQRNIDRFMGEMVPMPKLTEKLANVSSSLHTYLRKYDDSNLSVILYRMIDESQGMLVWLAFCQGLLDHDGDQREALDVAARACYEDKRTMNIIMEHALRMWDEESFAEMIKNLREWKTLPPRKVVKK